MNDVDMFLGMQAFNSLYDASSGLSKLSAVYRLTGTTNILN